MLDILTFDLVIFMRMGHLFKSQGGGDIRKKNMTKR